MRRPRASSQHRRRARRCVESPNHPIHANRRPENANRHVASIAAIDLAASTTREIQTIARTATTTTRRGRRRAIATIDAMATMATRDARATARPTRDAMLWTIEELASAGVDATTLRNLLPVGLAGEGALKARARKRVRHFFLLSASIAAIDAAEGEETEKSLETHRDAMARARDACFQQDDGDEEDLIGEDTEAFRAYVKAADRAIEVLGMREACEGLDERRSARDETPRDAVRRVVEEWKDALLGVHGRDVDEHLDRIEDAWTREAADRYHRLCEVEEWDEPSRALVKKALELLRAELCGKATTLTTVQEHLANSYYVPSRAKPGFTLGKRDDGVREWVDVGARGVKRRAETNADAFVSSPSTKRVHSEEASPAKPRSSAGRLGGVLSKPISCVRKSVDAPAFIKSPFGKSPLGKSSRITASQTIDDVEERRTDEVETLEDDTPPSEHESEEEIMPTQVPTGSYTDEDDEAEAAEEDEDPEPSPAPTEPSPAPTQTIQPAPLKRQGKVYPKAQRLVSVRAAHARSPLTGSDDEYDEIEIEATPGNYLVPRVNRLQPVKTSVKQSPTRKRKYERQTTRRARGRPKNWTPEEETALIEGVEKFGSGKWKTILADDARGKNVFAANARTNVDLAKKWYHLRPSHLSNMWRQHEQDQEIVARQEKPKLDYIIDAILEGSH